MGSKIVAAVALDELIAEVGPKRPVHLHLDEVEAIDRETVVARAFALYAEAVAALARAGASTRLVPMLSFSLAASERPLTAAPAWREVAQDVTAEHAEPPAVYLTEAAGFHRPAAGTVRVELAAVTGAPSGTLLEYRTSLVDEEWSRRIIAFPRAFAVGSEA